MKFWQLLRWIGSALVLVVAVLAVVAALRAEPQTSDPAPNANPNPQGALVPPVQHGNNRGL